MDDIQALVRYIKTDLTVAALDDPMWSSAEPVNITTYWNGVKAPRGRWFEARMLWSDSSFYIRFDAVQAEPLLISDEPDLTAKTQGLWERDVCEIFIAPEPNDRNRYFEFEVAPTGEWIDLAINVKDGERVTDWNYSSRLQTAAEIRDGHVISGLKIDWAAFDKAPHEGEKWLGNIFRCVGAGPTRGYLAWQPTLTDTPNFHVPESFGELVFIM